MERLRESSGDDDDNTSLESRLDVDVEVLGQSLIGLQLRQENDRLRQAVDVLIRAHAKLSDDLALKNNQITQLQNHCWDLKRLEVPEMESHECKKDCCQCAAQMSELSEDCDGLQFKVVSADSHIAALHCKLDSHWNSVQQTTISEKTSLSEAQLSEEQSMLISQQADVVAASTQNCDLAAQNTDLQRKLELAEKECQNLQLSLNKLHDKTDNEKGELQQQLESLQCRCKISEDKREVLRLKCEELTMENANLKLEDEMKLAEMQAKVDELEHLLLCSQKDLTESRNVAEKYLGEKAAVQNELISTKTERDCLCIELDDLSVRCHNSEKSLLESQDKLMQQVKEKDSDVNCIRQQTEGIRETVTALLQQLKREQSEKMKRKEQMMKLMKEIENLEQNITKQNGIVADMLTAKEENSEQIAALQLQTEYLTIEKVYLEQQVEMLENSNSSLQKDLTTLTDSYENVQQIKAELQSQLCDVCAREQILSDQLSSLNLLYEQRKSEKEELSHSVASLKQKVDADALERTASISHIRELEEQISVVENRMKELSAEKHSLVDDVNKCKDLIEQQKQSLSDGEHENKRCQKLIADFEERSLKWRDEKLCLEGRIRELESCATCQAVQEQQNLERTGISDHPDVMMSNNNLSETDEHPGVLIQSLEPIEERLDKDEIKSNIITDGYSLHDLCPVTDNWNMSDCQSLPITSQDLCEHSDTQEYSDHQLTDTNKQMDSLTEVTVISLQLEQELSSEEDLDCDLKTVVHQAYISEKCPCETEKVDVQSLLLEDAVAQENGNIEPSVDESIAKIDASTSLANKEVAGDSIKVDTNDVAEDSGSLFSVADSYENANCVVCVKDEPLNAEDVAHSNDPLPVKIAHDSDIRVGDAAVNSENFDTQCGRRRRVIKRFSRLPQSSATARHDRKPSSVCHNNALNSQTGSACSLDMNVPSVDEAVDQVPDSGFTLPHDGLAGNVNKTDLAAKLQENTSNIPVSACDAVCLADCLVHEAGSCDYSSACVQPSCWQDTDSCSQQNKENGDCHLSTGPECLPTLSVIVSDDMSSDNRPNILLKPSSKRLNVDMNGDVTKKVRSG